MFSRLAWIGKESIGETRVLLVTPDQKYVTTGSDDGYVFVYDAETGLPVCSRKPLSKHIAGVIKVNMLLIRIFCK
jgi:WD40 repeat protein